MEKQLYKLKGVKKICIQNALYAISSKRNLLSFRDIKGNGYHIKRVNEKDMKYLFIKSLVFRSKVILEKLHTLLFGLYYTNIFLLENMLDPKSF